MGRVRAELLLVRVSPFAELALRIIGKKEEMKEGRREGGREGTDTTATFFGDHFLPDAATCTCDCAIHGYRYSYLPCARCLVL